MAQPDSIQAWQEREEQAERRQEAYDRYRRQQYELFEIVEDTDPCPNCGEIGYEPVYGVSEDASVGYSCDEQGCTACIDSFGRAK